MTGTVGIIGGNDRQLEPWLRAAGLRCVLLRADELSAAVRGATGLPDVVLVDVREQRTLLGGHPQHQAVLSVDGDRDHLFVARSRA